MCVPEFNFLLYRSNDLAVYNCDALPLGLHVSHEPWTVKVKLFPNALVVTP